MSELQLTSGRMKEDSCRKSSLKRQDVLGIHSALSASQLIWERHGCSRSEPLFPMALRACPGGPGNGGEDGVGEG